MAQTSAQLVPLDAGTQFSSARYVDWPQVQGFLDMAESALRAKNTANDILLKEKAIVLQHMSHQSEQSIQEVRHGQAEDTTFLRQQLEALLRERAAAKERIAGLERENSFLLDERDILFRQLELEAGKVETDRSFRTLMSARRSEEDMSALMHAALHPQQHAWEPMTPQEAAEGTRLFPSQPAAARGDDDSKTLETEVMQDAAFAHQGHSHLDSSNAQAESSSNASFSSSQSHRLSRQPLQARPDHSNAAHPLQQSALVHQHSGDKH
ncbi:hypothetical protein WJX77_010108 [Trebouxia sp. C0004]